MITKEKFWIEDKGSCWDLYVYVPLMYSYYHVFRAPDRAGIVNYMTRRHLAGSCLKYVSGIKSRIKKVDRFALLVI